MRAYLAFTKKELLESFRTYKLLILIIAFLFFGVFGPLMAKLTPKILESLVTEGMQIIVAEPSAIDSWAQFFKNVSQMGFIIIAILFSGIMANEFNRGTFINMLTKGMPRCTIILSKFTVAIMMWTVSYVLCFSLSYAYTLYYWGSEGVSNLLMSVFCLWVFGVLFMAVILLGGTIFKTSYGCLMFVAGTMAILFTLNMVPQFKEYNPIALILENMSLLTENTTPENLFIPIFLSIFITIISLLISIRIFNKKQL